MEAFDGLHEAEVLGARNNKWQEKQQRVQASENVAASISFQLSEGATKRSFERQLSA